MDPNSINQQAPPAAAGMPNAAPQPVGGYSGYPQQQTVYPQAAAQYAAPQQQYPQQQMQGMAPMSQPGTPPPIPVKSNPNSTQNTLQIAEIRDGIVIMSDGSFRSVVMVKSINFDLMSPQEREAVEYSYQGFLNSVHQRLS